MEKRSTIEVIFHAFGSRSLQQSQERRVSHCRLVLTLRHDDDTFPGGGDGNHSRGQCRPVVLRDEHDAGQTKSAQMCESLTSGYHHTCGCASFPVS